MGDLTRLVKFLERVEFQPLAGQTLTDRQLVEAAQSIWDAQINTGNTIPEGTQFPSQTIGGVEIDWDADQLKFVLTKGTVVVRDNLIDSYVPNPVDLENDEIFTFHDDQYAVYGGGVHDDQLMLVDYVS